MSSQQPHEDHDPDQNRQPLSPSDQRAPDRYALKQDEQRRLTLRAMTTSELTVQEVWIHYFGLCGTTDEYEVDAYLHGLIHLPAYDRDLIAVAVNELIDETPPPLHAPYSYDKYPHTS